jgi:hypothetical protein
MATIDVARVGTRVRRRQQRASVGVSETCSTMKLPGVSSVGSCPAASPPSGMPYRCGQPSWYERKAMRPARVQCRLVPPCVDGTEPRSVGGACQSRRAEHPWSAVGEARHAPTSAVQTPHAWCRATSSESTAPPAPGRRTKASRAPSGDQRGDPSRDVEGAIHRTGVESPLHTPTNAWSPRPDTKASRRPSGDQRGSDGSPRVAISLRAGDEPSSAATHTARSFTNATRAPSGDSAGSSPPSAMTRGAAAPSNGATHSCSRAPPGLDVGSTGTWSSQLPECSPPRTYTTHRPSAESETLVSSWPSSAPWRVSWRAANCGPSATHTLRRPCSSNAQATRRPVAAAVSSVGNG